MFSWKKKFLESQKTLGDLCLSNSRELGDLHREIIRLNEEIKSLKEQNYMMVSKMSDKVIEMAMVDRGRSRDAVAVRAQERMDSTPLHGEQDGGWTEDGEEEWPPKGHIEVRMP